jgi:cytochrome c553
MKTLLKTACLLTWGIFSFASASLYAADIKAGEKKAAQCTSCHGAKGISSNSQYPNLAGQRASYLNAQLNAFKDGTRVNPMMQGVAASLTDAEIDNLADFFASLPNDSVNTKAKAPADASAKFAMCASCHGSAGEGRSGFPKLANQHAEYTAAQLLAFKKGVRKGGPMSGLVANLSEEDIKGISVYLSTLSATKE